MSQIPQEQRAKIEEAIDHRVRRDRVLLNNPVIMQGMGLAPLIYIDTSGKNAFLLSLAVVLLLTPTRVIAAGLCRYVHARFRGPVYALTAATVFVAVYAVMSALLPSTDLARLGLYLPLLVVDPIVLKRYERVQNERIDMAINKGLVTTAGYVLVLFVVGLIREFLGLGMVLGVGVLPKAPMAIALTPAGGFVVLAFVMALWRSAVRVIKRGMVEMEEEEWETQ